MRHAFVCLGLLSPAVTALPAWAITDEIQVYTGDIEPAGTAGLTWHNNYAINGLKAPDMPGGLIDKGTKGKRRRTVPLIPEIRDLVAQRSDGCARQRHRQVLRRTGADTSSSNTFAPETRLKR